MPSIPTAQSHLEIDIGFNFFGTTTLDNLEKAWFSLSKQDFTGVRAIYFLDNNTPYSLQKILKVLDLHKLPVPIMMSSVKDGDLKKTHSWSVNFVCRDQMPPDTDWIFWTRSDYILDFCCLEQWRIGVERELADHPDAKLFATSWTHLIGYNMKGKEYKKHKPVNIEKYKWRERGPRYLVARVPGYDFSGTHRDAGVWLCQKKWLAQAGWMDERLVSWGFQQSIMQYKLKKLGVQMMVATEYFFHHMEHPVNRDLKKAGREFDKLYPEYAAQALKDLKK